MFGIMAGHGPPPWVARADLSGEFSHRVGSDLLTSRQFVKAFTSTPTTADDNSALVARLARS